ncbi:MAG: SET domain-containing protein [Verrucomicrobiales bacterium]|jgi:SET domain-containing protein
MSTDTSEPELDPDVSAETERPMMTSAWAEVYDSPVHGRGMVATVDISEEATIIEYVGELVDKDESNRRGQELAELAKETGGAAVYLFVVNDEFDCDGNIGYNTARLINHSCDPNCEAQIDDDERIWIVATKDIPKAAELTFNYGFDLDDYKSHPCCCGSANCVGYICGEEYWDELKKKLKKKANKKKKKLKDQKNEKKGRKKDEKRKGKKDKKKK